MIIEGERLILRSWTMEDKEALVDGLNNINVSKWMASVPFPYTLEDARAFIEYAQKTNNINLAIVLKETGEVIGGTELTNINHKDGTAGGGIWLNENYHGKGYGTEAFCIRNRYAFEILELRRLENGYFPGNEPSKNMQEKLGYKYEGLKRKRFMCMATGEYTDECITGLLKEEFIDITNK